MGLAGNVLHLQVDQLQHPFENLPGLKLGRIDALDLSHRPKEVVTGQVVDGVCHSAASTLVWIWARRPRSAASAERTWAAMSAALGPLPPDVLTAWA